MTLHLGNVDAGTTLYIPFHTFDSNGASITLTGLAVTDIEIFKNGSVTQRSSDAGYTLLDTDGIDFDGLTGIHGFSIDLSDNTDSGFYAAGSFYWVVVSAVTVDTRTVSFVAATFRIGPVSANVTQWLSTAAATPTVAGVPEVDVTHLLGTAWLAPGTAGTPDVNVKLISDDATAANNAESFFDGTGYAGTNNVIPLVTTTTTATTATNVTTVNGLAAGVITAASIATDAIDSDAIAASAVTEIQSGLATPTNITAGTITTVTNLTNNNDKTGYALSSAGVQAIWDALTSALTTVGSIGKLIVDNLNATIGSRSSHSAADVWAAGTRTLTAIDEDTTTLDLDATVRAAVGLASANLDTQLDALPTNAELATALGTADDAVLAAIAALNNLSAAQVNAEVVDVLRTDTIPDSVPADGSLPTAVQALYMVLQFLTEKSVSGTTLTVRKVDGSTSLATYTLDDATSPTSITRAS